MTNKDMERDFTTTAYDLFILRKENLFKIILSTILGLIIAVVITFLIITPKYSSTADLVINDPNASNEMINSSIIQTNLSLLNTYEGIIEKPNVLLKTIEETGAPLTVSELQNMTTVSTLDDSLLLSITVTSDSPYLSAELANSISNNFADEVQQLLQVDNVYLWTQATPVLSPVSPNLFLNIIIGLTLGGLVGVLMVIVNYILDPSVRSIRIVEKLNLTTLGTIPEMSEDLLKSTSLRKRNSSNKDSDQRRRV